MSQPVSLPRSQSSMPARQDLPRVSISAAPPRQAFTSTPVFDWDDEWRRQAGCRDTDPALFFPVGSSGTALAEIDAAKAVCARCGVREACLEFAIQTNQEAGIWGGTSEDERRRLRRRWVAARRAEGATS